MDELINSLRERAGLSQEQAEKAVGVFADFMKDKVSDEQIQAIAEKIPGLGQFSDKLPSNLGDQIGGMASGLFKKREG